MRYTAEEICAKATDPIRERARELSKRIWDLEVEGGLTLFDRGVIELGLILLADGGPGQGAQ